MDAASFEPQCYPPLQAAIRHTSISELDPVTQLLVELAHALKDLGYRFTTITPSTHARIYLGGEIRQMALLPMIEENMDAKAEARLSAEYLEIT